MDYVWGNDEIVKLIEHYQSHRCLWDSTISEYKNKTIKAQAWDALSKSLDVPRRDVEIKVHILRSQFSREKKKFTSEDSSGGARRSRWMFYDRLKFLLDVATSSVDTRRTNENELCETNRSPSIKVIRRQTTPKLLRRKRRTSDKHNVSADSVRSLGDLIEMDRIAKRAVHESKDEFDIYGQYVASELRAVSDKGAVLRAKSTINDVLIRLRLDEHGSSGEYRGSHGHGGSHEHSGSHVHGNLHGHGSSHEYGSSHGHGGSHEQSGSHGHGISHGHGDSHGQGGSHEQPGAVRQPRQGEGTEGAPTHVKPEEMATCHRTE